MARPTFGVCDVCGVVGPLLTTYDDVREPVCAPCAVLLVAERSGVLAVLEFGGVPFVTVITETELAALN